MIGKVKAGIQKHLSNIPGWRTNRKIVVIESDDWGSIRMSSNEAREKLSAAGLTLDKGAGARYNLYDTLASKQDLSNLFEVLESNKDSKGKSAKITAVSVGANPDFEKIKAENYANYYYEPMTKTLERYNMSDAFPLWKEGKERDIFVPEFHGREHLNISSWMRSLKSGDPETLLAFDHGVTGFKRKNSPIDFQAAFDLEYTKDLAVQKEIIKDGLVLFEKLHGYKSRFFVPPNGKINSSLEDIAAEQGVVYISTPKSYHEVLGEGQIKKHYRYIGKKNENNQLYITRNGFFEPSGSERDEVNGCLAEIGVAFMWNKPAIISSHRVNYIGSLDERNRDSSLKQLDKLLKTIIKKWPDVEFMTSSELGDVIAGK